jgi:hypothetical protein
MRALKAFDALRILIGQAPKGDHTAAGRQYPVVLDGKEVTDA